MTSARRLRVLHCIYDHPDNPWVGGGGARRVFDLYRRLGAAVDATIACGNFHGATNGARDEVRVQHLGARWPYAWSRLTYARAATRLLATAEYDAAVVDHSAYTPIVVPRDRPVGMVVHHVTGPVASRRWGTVAGALVSAAERALLRRARLFSATSAASQRAIESVVAPGTPIVRVTSGVPDELFAVERRERNYVLYIGRLDVEQKGVDVLLDAFVAVSRTRKDVALRIVGRGSDERALRERATSLGIGGVVTFLGAVTDDERAALLAGAMCQVVPSRFEGFGIAAAEALAAGVPLIVSDDPALVEIAEGAGTPCAVVVPRDRAEPLSAALLALLADHEERARLSREGRVSAERFRWSRIVGDHLEFLRSIAHAHAVRR